MTWLKREMDIWGATYGVGALWIATAVFYVVRW